MEEGSKMKQSGVHTGTGQLEAKPQVMLASVAKRTRKDMISSSTGGSADTVAGLVGLLAGVGAGTIPGRLSALPAAIPASLKSTPPSRATLGGLDGCACSILTLSA